MTPPLFYGSGDAFQQNTSALPFYEEKEGLLAFLIQELAMSVLGTGDEEVLRREEEMDSGAIAAIFLRGVSQAGKHSACIFRITRVEPGDDCLRNKKTPQQSQGMWCALSVVRRLHARTESQSQAR
jgi:hypothetical protein